MQIKLPTILEIYVNAANAGDADKGSSCFSESATVLDEGKTLTGRKSIRDWMIKTKKKYNHTARPVQFQEKEDEAILTAEVAGNFDGSPVTLEYRFTLKNDLIETLRIQ